MLARFISLLVLAAPLASAITLSTPTNVKNGDTITITWTQDPTTDPDTFSLELANPSFNNDLAIASNVVTSTGSVSVSIQPVPVDTNYVIKAVNIFNISQIYSQTSVFAIGAASSSTGSSTGSGSTSVTATGTSTNSATPTANSLPATTGTATTRASSLSSGSSSGTSNTGTASDSGASTLPTSAAVSSRLALTNACGYAVLLLVGGAFAVAL